MREILFRGKTYDGKWEQGDLRHGGYVHNDSKTYIMRADYALHNIPVDPKTVGQYTGLTDKNGTKIFEGDVLEYINEDGEPHRIKVIFDKGAFLIEDEGTIDYYLITASFCLGISVVGNIYDNPELLKERETG